MPPNPQEIMRVIGDKAFPQAGGGREMPRSPPGTHFGIPKSANNPYGFGVKPQNTDHLTVRIFTKDGKSYTVGQYEDLAEAEATAQAFIDNMKGDPEFNINDWTVERQPYGFIPDVTNDDLMGS